MVETLSIAQRRLLSRAPRISCHRHPPPTTIARSLYAVDYLWYWCVSSNSPAACYQYNQGTPPLGSWSTVSVTAMTNLLGSTAALVLSGCFAAFVGAVALLRTYCWKRVGHADYWLTFFQLLLSVFAFTCALVGNILPVAVANGVSWTVNGPGLALAITNSALTGLSMILAFYSKWAAPVTPTSVNKIHTAAPAAATPAPATTYASAAAGAPSVSKPTTAAAV